MTSERTLVLQISSFDNCDGCKRRVNKALRGHVKSLSMDQITGDLTVLTNKDTEVIIDALKCEFQYRDIIMLCESRTIPNPPHTLSYPRIHQVIPRINFQDMAQTSQILFRDKGVESVDFTQRTTISRNDEITQTNSFMVNFNNSENQQTTSRYAYGHNNVMNPRYFPSLPPPS